MCFNTYALRDSYLLLLMLFLILQSGGFKCTAKLSDDGHILQLRKEALKPDVTPRKNTANGSNSNGTNSAAAVTDDDDVDAVTAALADTQIADSSTVVATDADNSSSDHDAVQAAKAWRVVDIKVLKDVWVVCSSKECAPVQVQVDFLGPYCSA
jgi:hypothetical protein